MLEIRDVALRPGAPRFSHCFSTGEICVILGPNQSGKTNLCRLIAGLPTEAEGQVIIDGGSLQEVPVRRRPVAMVYQAFINYPNLTVAQNIASPLPCLVRLWWRTLGCCFQWTRSLLVACPQVMLPHGRATGLCWK